MHLKLIKGKHPLSFNVSAHWNQDGSWFCPNQRFTRETREGLLFFLTFQKLLLFGLEQLLVTARFQMVSIYIIWPCCSQVSHCFHSDCYAIWKMNESECEVCGRMWFGFFLLLDMSARLELSPADSLTDDIWIYSCLDSYWQMLTYWSQYKAATILYNTDPL